MINNNLNSYDFIEGKMFIPKSYEVIVSSEDNIISVTGDGSLLGVVKLDVTKNTISLIGKNGRKFSSAELPLVDVISDAYYDEETTSLIIKVILSDGSEKEISVPFNDLLNDCAKKTDVDNISSAITKMNEDIIELSRNLANERNDRTEADSELIIIIQEVSEKVKSYEDGLKAEEQSRIDGDERLSKRIDDLHQNTNGEIVDIKNLIETVDGKIQEEVHQRIENDNVLQSAIEKEVNDRTEVDKAIESKINELDGKSVKWTDVHTEDNPNRKSVILENHDTILGKDTKGSAYNLVMLSKWDVADFGSTSVNVNLNGKGERPTYNDSKGLALMEDITNMSQSIKLIKNTDLNYSLMVGESNVGSIIIPKDQFLKSVSYESETKEIVFVFETTEGESTIRIELNELVDAYKAGLGLDMENNTFNVLIDKTSETNQYLLITEHGLKLNGIDEKFAQYTPTVSLNEDFATKVETDSKLNEVKDSVKLISDNLALKVDKVEDSSLMTSDEKIKLQGLKNINIDAKERHLVLDENSNLSFKYQFKKTAPYLYQFLDKDGRQIANVDNIDFTSDFESILNMVRQKAWQLHLDKTNAKISALEASITILNDKINKLLKTNIEVQETHGSALNLNDTTKDYIVKGDLSEKSNIKAKSIVMDNVSISNNARLSVDANDVVFNGGNISGDFPKKDGNAAVVINNAEYITFKNMTINSNNIYNAIEIGYGEKNVLPKNVLFDNCKFEGKFSNNTILIFGTQDNATITLSNCTFPNVSNVLRLSNKTNANGVVVNVNNCKVEQWDVNTPWQGFLICEDYTSKTVEEAETNNLYGDGKIVVNFVNLFHKGEKVMPSNIAEVCGSKNEKQVIIVCVDAIQQDDYCLSYIPNRFPIVKFS